MRPIRAVPRLCPPPRRLAGLPRTTSATAAHGVRQTLLLRSRVASAPKLSFLPAARCFTTSLPRLAEAVAKKEKIDMDDFPPERIRNLSIIAHIDHGKSTLADRLLQMTNTLPAESSPQFLDKLKVERERGITVKAQTVSIIHTHTDGKKYLINLIDTPGHVDFSYEVSRSLGACEGGLLLVDCTQGIQAQTLSVYHHALEAELKLLAVINKVDLPHASPEETSEEIEASLGLPKEDHMPISAKSGLGVDEVLRQIVDGLPPPQWEGDNKLRALVFDTFYDRFRGVVSLIRIKSGSVKKGDKVRFLQAGKKYDVLEVGIHNPEEVPVDELKEGQVGYLVCNMKNSDEAHIGDTVCLADKPVEPLPGFQPMKAMVYAGVFPMDASEFPQLEESIGRLTLNDRSVSVERESSAALGQGFRLGFLGTLHMDVFRQRLEDEYSSEVIVTAPTVPFKVVYTNGKEVYISNPAEFPDVTDTKTKVDHVEEPMVNATIFVPTTYIGDMMDLCSRYRGVQEEYRFLEGTDRAILRYSLPLSEIVTDFFSDLKSASSGFASFDYEEAGYAESRLVKLNMLLNGKPVDALAMIVHRDAAQQIGRAWTKKLREVLPRQLFELAIQAAVGSKVVARETLSAMRKDVTAGLYGGHYERKMKHLNKQKEGKKRLKSLAGNIHVPQSAFYEVLSSRPRTYTTSARSNAADLSDLLAVHLPPTPSAKPVKATTTPAPISRHHIPPAQRSEILSSIHRDTTNPNATSEELFDEFTRLYLSTPSPLFTVPELQSIARAVHALDRRSRRRMRQANQRLETVVDALRDIVGNDAKATRGLEVAMLVSSARQKRNVSARTLRKAEQLQMSLFPRAPSDPAGRGQYARSLNHILYLCAMSYSASRLDFWWNRMIGDGIEPTSWAYLARIVLHGRMRRIDAAVLELERTLPKVKDPDGAIVLVNATMWLAARLGRYDIVSGLYTALEPGDPVELALSSTASGRDKSFFAQTMASREPDFIASLTRLQPSRETYALLVSVFAFRGDLVAALTVLRHMFTARHIPGVHEYVALFRGFARFGVVPYGPAGDATAAFPLWLDVRPAAAGRGITDLWDDDDDPSLGSNGAGTGAFTSNYAASAPTAKWTLTALEELFTSFLSLVPEDDRVGGSRAPSPKAVYFVLLAWARVTNADAGSVRHALRAMEQKFGPRNAEGWTGWGEDNRLQRVRRVVGAEAEGPDH